MNRLVIIPTQNEFDHFLQSCSEQGFKCVYTAVGRLPVVELPDLSITVSQGGLGKVAFAIQTQHLLDSGSAWDLVICAGAGGSLDQNLAVGDIVAATETVEHDIRNKFGEPRMPRFKGDEQTIHSIRQLAVEDRPFRIHFGPIASGDEDIVDTARQDEIKAKTGAIAVAWEGAGGARACQFSKVPFIELRGISDNANPDAPADYKQNLPRVMQNVADLVRSIVEQSNL